ncbi:hypothetical protein JYU34_006608 [Plutella xylostella]|uniref:Uncharacterized protein n=1 Tax=Plutella xylostella TaxID=51655 RepID=A0ABQ7QSI8_PLUXY|nr:hypothetical protein JYU34_006608 [Plutella xylostella]
MQLTPNEGPFQPSSGYAVTSGHSARVHSEHFGRIRNFGCNNLPPPCAAAPRSLTPAPARPAAAAAAAAAPLHAPRPPPKKSPI